MTTTDFSPVLQFAEGRLRTVLPQRQPCSSRSLLFFTVMASVLLAGATSSDAQTAASVGAPDGLLLLGVNGGVTTQVFSPGSVIILQHRMSPELAVAGLGGSSSSEGSQGLFKRGRRLTFASAEALQPGAPMITGFIEGFGYIENQSKTDTEQASDTTGRGGIVGLSVERGGWSVSVALDHFVEEISYNAGTFGNFEPLVDFKRFRYALPFPGAELNRLETGLTVSGGYRFSNGVQAFGDARIGTINLKTQREYFELFSVDDPVSANPSDNIAGSIWTQGKTEGVSTSVSGGLAYAGALTNGFIGGITGSLSWTEERLDGFEETTKDTGSDVEVRARYGEDVRTSVLSRLGVNVSRPIRAAQAPIIVPNLRAAWLHEFADESREIDNATEIDFPFESSYSTTEKIETNDPDRDYFTLAFGLSASNTDNAARLYIEYEQILGHNFIDAQTVRFGGEFRF
ncbi:MAG: autotransporter outer membrane beta-barrel domain-containing protein [Pseudomonadota bacterium]